MENDDQEEDNDIHPFRCENNNENQRDPTCQIIPISKKVRIELCKLWKMASLVKHLGKCLRMRFIKFILQKMWDLQEGFEFIDMKNDYYLVYFFYVQDYNFVFKECPLLIDNLYLIVQ